MLGQQALIGQLFPYFPLIGKRVLVLAASLGRPSATMLHITSVTQVYTSHLCLLQLFLLLTQNWACLAASLD